MEIPSDAQMQPLTGLKDLDKGLQKKMSAVFNNYLETLILNKIHYRKLLRQGQPDVEIVKAVKKEGV